MTTPAKFGFVGLGNMGGPMAANIAKAGFDLTVYDKAGAEGRTPPGAAAAASLAEVISVADTTFLSLPDGKVSVAVARDIAALSDRATTTVIDLSTIGIAAAQEAESILADAGIAYIDAPVSGGTAGARAATISLMWGGSADILERHRPVCQSISNNVFHIGDRPGQGQAMKLANNFLSATAMAATSEAIAFGLTQGLDMASMLEVLNVSSGQNMATADKFLNRILPGSYDAGFDTALMTKDVLLYLQNVRAAATADTVGSVVGDVWQRCDAALPGSDFTRIYDFVRGAAPANE